MTWPRAMRWPFSVVYGKPHGTSNTPSSAWRRCSQNPQAERVHIEQVQARVAVCATALHHWQGVSSAWRQRLSHVSRILQPWRLADSTRQTSQEVEEQLETELEAMETLLEANGLPLKKDPLAKGRKQRAGISALIDCWWQTVHQDLAQMAMPPKWTQWAEEWLLPRMYWHEQRRRTRCPGQKAQIARVLQAVEEAFKQPACTRQRKPEVLAGWQAWAAAHAKAFQRASSAVEGRNGSRAQMQHTHRGLPLRRYQVWTVLHNFDGRAVDGTTPASRFFRRSFPALFESVLSQIDALPMPRQHRQALATSH